ncbi:MAG: hypothetical protein ABID38_02775 [Candidatus Diapherotrites archaeon]
MKQEKPTSEEKRAIRRGVKEFREGSFRLWREINSGMKLTGCRIKK